MIGHQLFFILLAFLPIVHARQNVTAHDRSLSVAMPLPAFMQKTDPCACTYKGRCSCEGALEFMSCIKEKCDSGACKCMLDEENHFRKACVSMRGGCPKLGLQCESEEATCDGESVGLSQDVNKDDDGEQEQQKKQQVSEEEEAEQEQSAASSQAGDKPSEQEELGEQLEGEDKEQLPAGWEKAWSEEEKRYYFANRKTGESSWTKPAAYNMEPLEDEKQGSEAQDEESSDEEQDLPAGWEAVWSKDKERYYWHNSETGESTWVKPKAPIVTTSPRSKFLKKGGKTYIDHDHYKDKVNQLHGHEHHVFAKGIIAIIVVMSLTIALATSSSEIIEKNTWSTLDFIIVTFLALAWFYVTMHLLEFHNLNGWAKVTMHGGIAVFLLLASSGISMWMKKSGGERGVRIFNSIFNNILLWCFAGFVSTVQQMYKHSEFLVLLSTLGLVVFYAVLALFWYFVVGKCTDQESDGKSINTLAGAALAAGTVLWVHMVIAGGYHTVEDPRPTKPGFYEVLFMNSFSLIYIAVALVAGPRVEKWSDSLKVPAPPAGSQRVQLKTYWKKRSVDSLAMFVMFLPYYSCVLSLGHLIIDNLGYDESAIEARLYLAVVSSFIGMFLIVLVAKVGRLADNKTLSSTLIGLGGFMAGSAWGNLLNNSINMMAHGFAHPFKIKLMITCFLTAIVFPVYFYYFKPLVDAKMDSKSVAS